MSEDREAQEDELLALGSIYDEEVFHRAEAAQGGEIQLCLQLPPAFKVVVKGTAVTWLATSHSTWMSLEMSLVWPSRLLVG